MLGVGVVMILSAARWWWIRLCWRAGAEIGSELRVASAPVPSPAEIPLQLQAERGRQAILQEVAAVRQIPSNRRNQIPSNRRNEALLNSGIALGALYSIDHRRH